MSGTAQELGRTLDRDEMVVILEHIAREGGDTARIQAIKTLLSLRDEEPKPAAGFDALDGDELGSRRRRKSA